MPFGPISPAYFHLCGNFPNYSLRNGIFFFFFPTPDEMDFWKTFGQSFKKQKQKTTLEMGAGAVGLTPGWKGPVLFC